jgi:cysteine desulfurase
MLPVETEADRLVNERFEPYDPAKNSALLVTVSGKIEGLRAAIPGLHVNGTMAERLPHNLNVSFEGVEGEALVTAIDDIAVSSGAACGTGRATPSLILTALGVDPDLALASVRFGLGRWTTAEEIEYAIEKMGRVVAALRRERAAV